MEWKEHERAKKSNKLTKIIKGRQRRRVKKNNQRSWEVNPRKSVWSEKIWEDVRKLEEKNPRIKFTGDGKDKKRGRSHQSWVQ